jgi:hypothetical protein
VIVFFGGALRQAVDLDPVGEARLGLVTQFGGFVARRLSGTFADSEARQDRLARQRATVEASASGMSANSTASSARLLKR